MKTISLIGILVVISTGILFGQALPAGYLELPLNKTVTVKTIQGVKLATAFGAPEEYYAVLKIRPLKPGMKYDATFVYDAGTGIYYGMAWVDGDPGTRDWNSFVGVGSGTGSGDLRPGYDQKHLFRVDKESTSSLIYLIIRSTRPWTFNLTVTEAKPGIDRDTKNKYGYFMVDDHTDGDKRTFLLKIGK